MVATITTWTGYASEEVTRLTVYSGTTNIPYVLEYGTTYINIWKGNATDPTSFTAQDTTNRPSGFVNVHAATLCIDSNENIHVFSLEANTAMGGTKALEHWVFRTVDHATSGDRDTWITSEEEVVYTLTANDGSFDKHLCADVDTSDNLHVLFMDTEPNMGSNYDTLYYIHHNGTSWQTAVEVEGASNQVNLNRSASFTLAKNSSGTVVPQAASGYNDGATATYVYIGNALNATSFTGHSLTTRVPAGTLGGCGLHMATDSTFDNTYIAFIDYADDDLSVWKHTNSSSWTTGWTETDLDTTDNYRTCNLYVDDNDNIYCLAVETSSTANAELRLFEDTGSGWGVSSDSPLVAPTSTDDVHEAMSHWAPYTKNYDGGIGITYVEASNYKFREYSLGSTSYELNSAAGSYIITGSAAGLDRDLILNAAAGSYTYTGSAAGLDWSIQLNAEAGAYTYTGSAAGLDRDLVLNVDAGAYTISGSAAGLDRDLVLNVDAGSYTYTGSAASLDLLFILNAEAGAYTYTGSAAGLDRDLILNVDAGSYTISGSAAGLDRDLVLNAASGSYTMTGSAAAIERVLEINAESGSYIMTGSAAGLDRALVLNVDSGSYTMTGSVAGLDKEFIFNVDAGSYIVTGSAAGLDRDLILNVDAGAYTYTGSAAGLDRDLILNVDAGSYTMSGSAAGLDKEFIMNVDAGSYAMTGANAGLDADRILNVDAGSYTYTGSAAGIEKAFIMNVDAGSYAVAGAASDFERALVMNLASGAYSMAGSAAGLDRDLVMNAEAGAYSYTGALAGLDAATAYVMDASAGAYTISGSAADMERALIMNVDAGSYVLSGGFAGLDYSEDQPTGGALPYRRRRRM